MDCSSRLGLAGRLIRSGIARSKAISRNPQFVKAYANRAMAYHRLGLHKRALTDLDKAISLNSSLSKLFENRGKVYQSLGLEEDAKRDFNRAAALEKERKKAI